MAKYLVIVALIVGALYACEAASPIPTRTSQAVFPGNKWCADESDNATMKCCMEHLKCPMIPPFEEKYNFFNNLPMSIYECSCESRFYFCLRAAPMKKSLRQLMEMEAERSHCFNLVKKNVCLATSWLDWFGFGCKKHGDKLVAEMNRMKGLLRDLFKFNEMN